MGLTNPRQRPDDDDQHKRGNHVLHRLRKREELGFQLGHGVSFQGWWFRLCQSQLARQCLSPNTMTHARQNSEASLRS